MCASAIKRDLRLHRGQPPHSTTFDIRRGDARIEHLPAQTHQRSMGDFLVRLHQSAIAGDVGCQDRDKTTAHRLQAISPGQLPRADVGASLAAPEYVLTRMAPGLEKL